MRDWKKFENDEIMTIWGGYKSQEFGVCDPLKVRANHPKAIRLTPVEIINLVDELMDRLEERTSKIDASLTPGVGV